MNIFKKKSYEENGIVKFEIKDSIVKKVIDFYNESPFPNYENNDDKSSINYKGENNFIAKKTKEFIGFNKTILEVGCGTGQLSLYLAIGSNNKVIAFDPALESIKLGKDFSEKNNIKNIKFVNADIFDDVLEKNVFDFIWTNGVLHHTKNPYLAFEILTKSLKKHGYILVGLYNRYGRLRTVFRRYLYKIFGEKIVILLDPVLRNIKNKAPAQVKAWIRDQYIHPVESLHTIDEVLNWFDKNSIEFISSIPNCDLKDFNEIDIFNKKNIGTFISRILSQISMIFNTLGSDGGLFIMIGKKK